MSNVPENEMIEFCSKMRYPLAEKQTYTDTFLSFLDVCLQQKIQQFERADSHM